MRQTEVTERYDESVRNYYFRDADGVALQFFGHARFGFLYAQKAKEYLCRHHCFDVCPHPAKPYIILSDVLRKSCSMANFRIRIGLLDPPGNHRAFYRPFPPGQETRFTLVYGGFQCDYAYDGVLFRDRFYDQR